MKQSAKNIRELTVAYIGGGSRGWAWGFMMDLAMDADICGTVRLYDIDREAAERIRSSEAKSAPIRTRQPAGPMRSATACRKR